MAELQITFLGTGAADTPAVLPQPFQNCFSKEIRRNSCALVQDWLMIDCGRHALGSLQILGADRAKITDLCVTHTHDDHIDPAAVAALAETAPSPLRVWCDEKAAPVFAGMPNTELQLLSAGEQVTIGSFAVTPLAANHLVENSAEQPLHYLLEGNGKRFFYGCDGAWLRAESFLLLEHKQLDLMVVDATVGRNDDGSRLGSHNSLAMLEMLLPLLKHCGAAKDTTKAILSHLAITLHQPHDCVAAEMNPKGFIVAYDGLRVSF